MNRRGLRRYVDDLLGGRRPRPFQPDDFEADQLRTAIDLRAARLGADAPSQDFLTALQGRLAAQFDEPATDSPPSRISASRRRLMVGTSAAAAAAVAAVTVDRLAVRGRHSPDTTATDAELQPNEGSWHTVARSADVVADGTMHPFDTGSVVGFVHRVDGRAEAVSGVCTHQGCRLWFDKPDDRLRCPCHSTSFSPAGQVLTHQLPIAPAPLPALMVRENNGSIEVFAPDEPA